MSDSFILSSEWYEHLAEIFRARSPVEQVQKLACALKQLTRSDSVLIVLYSADQVPVFLFKDADHKLRKKNVNEYVSGPYLLDPYFQLSFEYDHATLIHLEHIAEGDRYTGDYYDTWIRYAGIKDEVNYFVPVGSSKTIAVSLSRNLDNCFFSDADIEQLQVILPLVAKILGVSWQKSEGALGSVDVELKKAVHDSLLQAMNNFGRSLLTEREHEIVQFLLRGYNIKTTAHKLGISPTTIKVHRKHIYQKLDISSHSELFSLFFDSLSNLEPSINEDPLVGYI